MTRRPADLPWTHAHLPREAEAFRAGYAAPPDQPLPPILAEDRHAWRGVHRANGAIPLAMAAQWRAFCDAEAWFAPVEDRQGETMARINDLASSDDELLASDTAPATRGTAARLPPPSKLPPAAL